MVLFSKLKSGGTELAFSKFSAILGSRNGEKVGVKRCEKV